MRLKKTVNVLIVVFCAAAVMLLAGLPWLAVEGVDSVMFREGAAFNRPLREGMISDTGRKNKTALALYIDHAYVHNDFAEASVIDGTNAQLAELIEAGVVPETCVLQTSNGAAKSAGPFVNGCVISVEPVSNIVISVYWNGTDVEWEGGYYSYTDKNAIPSEILLENFIRYLDLSGVDDWIEVNYKDESQESSTVGAWSPSTQLYVYAFCDRDGMSNGVNIRSYTENEMRPILDNGALNKN